MQVPAANRLLLCPGSGALRWSGISRRTSRLSGARVLTLKMRHECPPARCAAPVRVRMRVCALQELPHSCDSPTERVHARMRACSHTHARTHARICTQARTYCIKQGG